MNSIEEPVASKKKPEDQYMGICDQICMAVAIDEKCCLKSTEQKVSHFPFVRVLYFFLIIKLVMTIKYH